MRTAILAWRPLRHRLRYQRLGLLVLLTMLILSLLPLGGAASRVPNADKLAHFLAYTGLMAAYAQLLIGRRSRWVLALGLFAFGLLIEALQSLVDWRSADALDVLANAAGIALGALLTAGRGATVLAWLERRFG